MLYCTRGVSRKMKTCCIAFGVRIPPYSPRLTKQCVNCPRKGRHSVDIVGLAVRHYRSGNLCLAIYNSADNLDSFEPYQLGSEHTATKQRTRLP